VGNDQVTDTTPAPAPESSFQATRWTQVVNARDPTSPQGARALEELCRAYWYPLYAFVRRKGYAPQEAEDLTQGFFARFLEKRYLDDVAREKGKFRTFLLCALEHFLANEWDKSQRVKRGGGATLLPLETRGGEDRYAQEPTDRATPEEAFDRHWAESILARVLGRLRKDFEDSAAASRFDALKPFLLGEPGGEAYAVVAERLRLSEQGVKSAVHRLRQRFRALFREEIAQTVATRAEIDEELRYLVRLMTR